MSTAALADMLQTIRRLQEYCTDPNFEHARQHIEAALDYIAKGNGERAQRRITCAHVALQYVLEIHDRAAHSRGDDKAKEYLRAMILGEGDADIIMAELLKETLAEVEEVVA